MGWFLPEVIDYLNQTLSVPAFTTIPEERPTECVSVVFSSGRSDRYVERPTVMFHCWADSDANAMDLAYELADALFALPGASENVCHVEQQSMYAAYDGGSPLWNVTFTFIINR